MPDSIPNAIAVKKSRFSAIWLIPLVALLIGGWLTFKYLYEKGTVIEIQFSSADGLAAGKTHIKYKDVVIGVVDEITFTPDLENVIVTATIDSGMRNYLNNKARFWVVRARLSAGEVSGLGTLLSGAYIGTELEADSSVKLKTSYKGLDEPPALVSKNQGTQYRLVADALHSFDAGTPIYYRRLKVGEVLDHELDKTGSKFNIDIFIKAPYNELVRDTTLFWNASGIDMKLSADGFEMRTESMLALLQGGLAFDNIETGETPLASANTEFTLFPNREDATSLEYKRSPQQYRVYFDGSARGLSKDAPVTLRGITIGRVIDVSLQYDLRDHGFKIPVTMEFEPGRLDIIGNESDAGELPTMQDLVDIGLRAQLRSGNILTGQMLVDFDIYPDATPAIAGVENEYVVLPSIPTSIDSIKNSLTDVLEKIARMPLEEIGNNLNKTIEGANALVHSEDISGTLANINDASEKLSQAMSDISALTASSDVQSILSNIEQASEQLNKTLAIAESAVAGFSEDSTAYQQLLRTLRELSGATRALRQMAEYIERNPEALLKGKSR